MQNNPVNFNDPSGHIACWDEHANDPECKNLNATAYGLIKKNIYNLFANPKPYKIGDPITFFNTSQLTTLGSQNNSIVTIGARNSEPTPICYGNSSPQINSMSPNVLGLITNENIADSFNYIGYVNDVGEIVFDRSIPALSLGTALWAQGIRDSGKSLNPMQGFAHANIILVESVGTTAAASGFYGLVSVAVGTGPVGWFVGGVVVTVVLITSEKITSNFNETLAFPIVDGILK